MSSVGRFQAAQTAQADDLDPEALAVPLLVKIAAGTSLLVGIFTLGLAIQTSLMLRMQGTTGLIVGAMAVLGFVTTASGFGGLRGKASATIAGAVGSALIATLGSIWAVVALMGGLISPLSFFVVFLGVVSAIAGGVAIGPARKLGAARAKLLAGGLDFGV